MKYVLVASTLVFALSVSAAEPGKGLPETVKLPAASVKALQEKAKDARIARLEAEKLSRELELGKLELEKRVADANQAQEASDKEYLAACEKAGIPASEIKNYDGAENEKGEFVLKRRKTK